MHSMVDDAVDGYNMAYQYFAQAKAEAEDSFDDFFDEAAGFVDENAGDLIDQLVNTGKQVAVGKA